MATKRSIRAVSTNLEKATKELADCSDADQKGAKHRLENELAEAKKMMHLGKKEHADVERLGLGMGSARLVLKMYGKSGQTSLFLIDFWLLWSVQLFSFRHSFSKVLSDLREREFWIGRSRYERIESRPSLLLLHYYFSPSVYICRFLGSY